MNIVIINTWNEISKVIRLYCCNELYKNHEHLLCTFVFISIRHAKYVNWMPVITSCDTKMFYSLFISTSLRRCFFFKSLLPADSLKIIALLLEYTYNPLWIICVIILNVQANKCENEISRGVFLWLISVWFLLLLRVWNTTLELFCMRVANMSNYYKYEFIAKYFIIKTTMKMLRWKNMLPILRVQEKRIIQLKRERFYSISFMKSVQNVHLFRCFLFNCTTHSKLSLLHSHSHFCSLSR